VHVAWEDVEAHAAWAGKEIPTEAEWERDPRGGDEAASVDPPAGDAPIPARS
jgi:formylglycine-generating enzyme